MELTIIDSIDAVSAADFDRLDSSAGSAGCYQRTRQREHDGRWRCRYLRRTDGGRLSALVPLYTANGRSWPDPAYDPTTWELPSAVRADYAAENCLLVGSFADLRTGFAVAEQAREPVALRELLAALARIAAAEDRCLVFPYLLADARQALAAASDGLIGWAPLGREAQLVGVSEPGWQEGLRADARYNLRHDQALIATAGIVAGRYRWPEVEDLASEMIAEHNVSKGRFDHAEFVKMRNREWNACPGLEFTVFGVSSQTVTGFVTALLWQDQLEIYEIGIRAPHGPQRLAAYLDLVFHQPIGLARELRLRTIRLGPTAERVKAGRGAVFHDLHGGVLSVLDTKALAAGDRPGNF